MRRGGKCFMADSICRSRLALSPRPLPRKSLPDLPRRSMLADKALEGMPGETMTLLEKIQSMKLPFAELKGVTFVEADKDRVVAKMLVRPDLCTLHHIIHGGAIMAFADSVGAAA